MASQLAEQTAPRLFISYSHDSREHEDSVRALADRLRQDGIDAIVDQYNTAPPDGWPMWMDREIQKADFVALVCTETYLRRVEGREEPGKGRGVLWEAKLIYNHLYVADATVQKFIPILLEDRVPSFIPSPLRGLMFYRSSTEQGYEDFYRHLTRQPRHEKPALGKLRALPGIPPQSYPSSLEVRTERKPPTSLDQRNRLQMLKQVRLDWIDGVLNQSLYKVARIELGLEANSDTVEQPLNAIVQVPDRPPTAVPAGTVISQVFDDHAGALLILGAPGTGKTTLLLELAEQLLDRAEQDESHPIPVVFNLSSWDVRRYPLSRWLMAELNERSDVPKRLAQRWVETEQIMPLLDGLDEVAVDHRQACVEAINNFRRDHGLLPTAVCSRIADYEALGTKLRLRNAVVVQPLTRAQVQECVERIGEPLQALRSALEKDLSFWDLLETPLMLWVAMLAYRDAPIEFSGEDTFEQRRRRLFAKFVDAMLKRRSGEARYTPKQTLSWLSWLASALIQKHQTVFHLEDLNEEWLPTRPERWLSRAGTVVASGLSGGLIFGPILAVSFGLILGRSFSMTVAPSGSRSVVVGGLGFWLYFGLTWGLTLGLSLGLIGAFAKLQPIEAMRIGLAGMASRLRSAARVGLSVGLSVVLSLWLMGLIVLVKLRPAGLGLRTLAISPDFLPATLSSWLIGCVEIVLQVGLIVALITLLSSEVIETRVRPNQGTRRSVIVALTASVGGALIGVLTSLLNGALTLPPNLRGLLEVPFALVFGLVGGLIGGGLFSLRHFVLRLALWMSQSAPLNYVCFLDSAVERLFLRKVGGGYIFVHRMLLQYFASLAVPAMLDQDAVRSTPADSR